MIRLARWATVKLASPWTPVVASLVAIVLTLSSLNVGFQLDDYYHRLVLDLQYPIDGDTLTVDIFRFSGQNPEQNRLLLDFGSIPWWTSPNWKASFWRPVTAITHWLDYRLWPSVPPLMHLHSVLWFGLLVLVVGRFYRQIMGGTWIAGLATLLYALDDSHGLAAGWLANRNVVIATLLAVLSLVAHDRWRRLGWRTGAVAAPLLLAVALLAKEAAVGVAAYLFAYAVFLDKTSVRDRLLSLVPYAVIIVVWRLVWAHLGYGVAGMEYYTDPIGEPLRYASQALTRIPLLLLGQWAFPPPDFVIFWSAAAKLKLALAALPVLGMVLILLVPVLCRDCIARFWGLGMLLAVLPCAATMPSDRLLFLVGLGAMGLLAQFFGSVVESDPALPLLGRGRPWIRFAAAALLVVHVFMPLALTPLRAGFPMGLPEINERLYYTPENDESISERTVVIINTPSLLHTCMSWAKATTSGLPYPQRQRVLSSGMSACHVYRPDVHTLVVRPDGGYFQGIFDLLFRSSLEPMVKGVTVRLTDFEVHVLELTDDGRPAVVQFTFSAPLESPKLLWMYYEEDGYQPFTLPVIGDSVTVAEVPPLY